jgi:hypothetical protein
MSTDNIDIELDTTAADTEIFESVEAAQRIATTVDKTIKATKLVIDAVIDMISTAHVSFPDESKHEKRERQMRKHINKMRGMKELKK